MKRRRVWATRVMAIVSLVGAMSGRAWGQAEEVGRVLTLPEPRGRHWLWRSDILLHRTADFDADAGTLLGRAKPPSGAEVSRTRPIRRWPPRPPEPDTASSELGWRPNSTRELFREKG